MSREQILAAERPTTSHVEKRLAEAERRVAVLARALNRIVRECLHYPSTDALTGIADSALTEAGQDHWT